MAEKNSAETIRDHMARATKSSVTVTALEGTSNMAPYVCPVCRTSLKPGDRVVPYYIVHSADFLVQVHDREFYAHLTCPEEA